jgi:transmembrane sensor
MSISNDLPRTAALWVVRLERGLTATEQDEFLEWLTADPSHGDELSRQRAGWGRLDLLADWRPEHGRRPNRDLLAPPPTKVLARWKPQLAWASLTGLAAAALVALVFWTQRPAPAQPDVASTAPAIALIEERTLADGSVVALNRGARITVAYTDGERRVDLTEGEAHFQVAKNPARPFIVSVRGVDVRAVGTAFNVHLKGESVEVLVTEGKVSVAPAESGGQTNDNGSHLFLAAGQRTVVPLDQPAASAVTTVSEEEMNALLAWQPRLLDFTEQPLSAIVAEFNRRNAAVRLEIHDPTLAATVLNASLRSDNVEGFLRLLDSGFQIKATRSGGVITLRPAGDDAPTRGNRE